LGGKVLLFVPGIAAFMMVVGLLAAAGPARRGLRVQPTEALRAEG
jgi:ABC-type antimicrobial peptide transport system permease subunit